MDTNKLENEIKELRLKLRDLKNVEAEKRAEVGAKLNARLREAEDEFREAERQKKQMQVNAKLAEDELVDVTVPDLDAKCGHLHPITRIIREVDSVFETMGFSIHDCPEITTEWDNFDALNIPKHHPARDMQDTFYLENGQLMSPQNSSVMNSLLKKYGPELKVVYRGRCFRNEAVDASHDNTFFQYEGMMVGKDLSIANLIYFMKTTLTAVFKKEVQVRLRPGYFPFVEPGFELDIQCTFCGGKGCSVCKQGGWVELWPCGMVHPNVLRMGGIDPEKYQGFAFCLGITRLAMIKYGINEIRHFNSGNLEFLRSIK